MRITESRLRSIIRGILLENESNHTFEEIEKGSDFVKKCIEWCNGQRFRPDFFLKDEAIESFNCVHDLTFNTNYENLEELYRNKLTILSDNLENFESKREGINFPDSFKFSRLLKSSSRRRKDWIKPDYFYVRSFNQEDIARIKKEIEEGEQEYDVFIGDDSSLNYPVDVYINSIGKTMTEWLVNFKFLETKCEEYGMKLVETKGFNEVYDELTKSKKVYGEAMSMNQELKELSFMYKYFIFEKI